MNLFSSIVDQIISKLNNSELKNKEIKVEIEKVLGFEIKQEQVKVIRNTIFLDISPTLKTKVLLKKQEIIKSLNRFNIVDIK